MGLLQVSDKLIYTASFYFKKAGKKENFQPALSYFILIRFSI